MKEPQFDKLIHAPVKLQICALMSFVDEIEFKVLCEYLEISKSALSKHIKQLNEAGYTNVTKRLLNGRQHMWLALSSTGLKAYNGHIRELKRIIS